jgi:putative ABC transport system permease protein
VSLLDFLRSAFLNLGRRKLRSSLTILAVVIGASLVSLLLSLGIGVEGFLSAQVRAMMPPNMVMVAYSEHVFEIGFTGPMFGGKPEEISEDEGGSRFDLKPLTAQNREDIEALEHVERTDPYILLTADSVRLQGAEAKFRTALSPLPAYQAEMRQLVAGRYLTDQSLGECIIANEYLESFGFQQPQDALGQELVIQVKQAKGVFGLPSEIKDFNFEIVGVAEKTVNSTEIMISIEDGKELARFWADSPDLYSDELPSSILQVKVDGSQYAAQVAQEVEDLGLGAMTSDDVLGVIGTIFGIIQAVLGAFGLIALGVASLGVINTLIMAIYERTREIGVMKAVGASKSTIRLLFTAEGASIGFLGGIIGVAIAYALGSAINLVSHITFLKDFETFNISAFPWWLIAGVIAISTIIALLAALYPAHRASNLDPIEALRYE